MAIESFEELYRGICADLGLPAPPSLDPEELRFTLAAGEEEIDLWPQPAHDGPGVLISIDMGALPADREQALATDLMSFNFILTGEGGAVFTLDPLNGHLMLMSHHALARVTLRSMCLTIGHLIQAAQNWRRELALPPARAPQGAGVFA